MLVIITCDRDIKKSHSPTTTTKVTILAIDLGRKKNVKRNIVFRAFIVIVSDFL